VQSPYLRDFRTTACSTSLPLLPQHLASFPTTWPFPRGDLYHWTSLLNRFDAILENFCRTYKLDEGPQTTAFGCKVLVTPGETSETPDLTELGYGSDGDRQLIESILSFSRVLLQNCGNRSLYASSAHLNNLLNSTSLSLLEITLSLGSELAQRYLAAFKRQAVSSRQPNNPQLLQNHYNIDLARVQQLALPFTKTVITPPEPAPSAAPTTPSVKGKEKATAGTPVSPRTSPTTVRASDLVSMAKGGSGVSSRTNSPKSSRNGADNVPSQSETSWEEWGDVKVTYYPKVARDTTVARSSSPPALTHPTTPTPIRRSSNLGPHAQRSNRASSSDDSPSNGPRPSTLAAEETPRPTFKTIEIPTAELKSTGVHALLEQHMAGLPEALQYELLTKLRVADALTSSVETRRQILAVRLLAITNLSYIHLEEAFTEKVLKQDSGEPRRLQLVYQLAELVHPPAEGAHPVPRPLQTIAFSTLDALSQHPSKYNDVCAALSTNVSHGVLLYVIRKAVAEMGTEPPSETVTEQDEWREALFSLLSNISAMPRAGAELITAGLMPVLVEILSLRTAVAERYQPKVISFLDNIMYSARDAFQTLVDADGLQAISDLIVYEVTNSSENVAQGRGIRPEYCSAAVDYEIPYFQQQTLKWLFKFIHHMMTTAGGYGGNYDRLLRNLIDSSPLLGGLREIISNAHCFGSVVWTNAVGILNDFINNEPTSFAVIAEAGLSRALLEAVTCSTITMPSSSKDTEPETVRPSRIDPFGQLVPAPAYTPGDDDGDDGDDGDEDSEDDFRPAPRRPTKAMLQAPREGRLASGIMPTSETINIIPQAFGAICLNNAGMKMFLASHALESFFEIFESPEHVKCMDTNKELASNLGSSFDELVRHHPPLKTAILNAILDMVARVSHLCKTKAEKNKLGAVLRIYDEAGKPVVAGAEAQAPASSKGKGKAVDDGGDVEMPDAGTTSADVAAFDSESSNSSMTPYVSALATFLSNILTNTSVRSDFCTRGGIEYVLDLADSPCLAYDFADGSASRILHGVISLLSEQKPHLTMPSLLQRAQSAADVLAPFANHRGPLPFFQPFVDKNAQQFADLELLGNGTNFVKAFVNVHSLVSTLNACLHPSSYTHRSAVNSLTQLNLGDYYAQLVKTLGPLLGACFREEYVLDRVVPNSFESAARIKNSTFSDPIFAGLLSEPEAPSPAAEPSATEPAAAESSATEPAAAQQAAAEPSNAEPGAPSQPGDASSTPAAATSLALGGGKASKVMTKAERDSPEFRNFQTLRYLLRKMFRTVSPFFQILGKGLIPKRSGTDVFQKQSHAAVAGALAETILRELAPHEEEFSVENTGQRIGMLHVLKDMLTDGKQVHCFQFVCTDNAAVSRHSDRPTQAIALVLNAFKQRGGFDTTNRILESFAANIRPVNASSDTLNLDRTAAETIRSEMSIVAVKEILSLYSQIVNGKNVTESIYTLSMLPRDGRDRSRPDYFAPDQFLVELRMAVLPVIRRLWESDLAERAQCEVAERLIDVIRTISTADNEINVIKRSDKAAPVVKPPRKPFRISEEHLATLLEEHSPDLAQEALYRCSNSLTYSIEYCREVSQEGRRRNPIPEGDITLSPDPNSSSRPRTVDSTGTATPDDHAMGNDPLAHVPALIESLNSELPPIATTGDSLASQLVDQLLETPVPSLPAPDSGPSSAPQQSTSVAESQPSQITIDDLNEERAAIRHRLIDKCLDVINAHGGVTFQIADLITTAVNKSPDPPTLRKSVGTTLVIALISFAGEDDLSTSGKKIAAYAHLVALLLKDKNFYPAVVSELKDYLGTLLGFIKLSPNHSSDDPSPWIAHILLIVEMLLSEDARPRKAKWTAPKDENEKVEPAVLESVEPAVSPEERVQLLEAVLDIMPRIGKDESLALSVLRILVILTRERSMAQTVGEKKNIQRLFVAAKQLAGASSARIQSPLMLILRHIIEDDETVKQIMRSDIKAFFESNRQLRSLDVSAYLRGLASTAIRAPELFVEITNEMVKFSRWSYNASEATSRGNTLVLKDPFAPGSDPTAKAAEDAVQPTVQATEDLSLQDVKRTTEDGDSQMPDAAKPAAPEHKLPVVENPDGVIHFLLCELLNYKDVEDKDPVPAPAGPSTTTNPSQPPNPDVTMAEASSTNSTPSTEATAAKNDKATKTPAKEEFKAEEHPIYIYRCFLLQCLTELLASYNRTKIEFINFKRSAPPQPMTPSKPRSSVVNYLLADLIPSGTPDTAGSIVTYRKKTTTSTWADSVIVALLAKTGEQLVDKSRDASDGEDEPDLLFVRRFVLENVLKAYKEAAASNEALDVKYSRMYSLAVLMGHVMNGKEAIGATDTALANRSHQQLRRIMFEKGFVVAVTASIADIDLNYPGAKDTVRQILKPLRLLTETAIHLSGLGLVSGTQGQTEDDGIESATSVSDLEDEREETPDLFRNSTLGMFEPDREEPSSSSESEDGKLLHDTM
jgi:E3 ubiquitin-protein ligase HUWE1